MAEQIPLFDAGGESDGVEKIVVKPAPEVDWRKPTTEADWKGNTRFINHP